MCPFPAGDLKHGRVKIVGWSSAIASSRFPNSSCILEQSSSWSVQKAKAAGELLVATKDGKNPRVLSLWGADPTVARKDKKKSLGKYLQPALGTL